MMLPMVAGSRFRNKKLPHVRIAPPSLRPAATVAKYVGSKSLIESAEGMKYMSATQCANPHATKAEIGGRMERILSVVLRALKQSHTA